MESDYDEDRGAWTEEMTRSEDCIGEDSFDNPQEILNECLDKFKTPDYIMEPGIFAQLKRYSDLLNSAVHINFTHNRYSILNISTQFASKFETYCRIISQRNLILILVNKII